MKPALFVLLCICAGVPVALAQTAPTSVAPTSAIHHAAEIEWKAVGPALILLVGAVAIVRGRRRG